MHIFLPGSWCSIISYMGSMSIEKDYNWQLKLDWKKITIGKRLQF